MNFTYSQPVVGALAIVARHGKLLLVRRRMKPSAGLWGFPGGKVELGELISDAARRELREETSLEALPGVYMAPIDVIEHDLSSDSLLHFVLVPVQMREVRGKVHAGDDAAEARWFSLEELEGQAATLCEGVLKLAKQVLS